MIKTEARKESKYDLEQRTLEFGKAVILFCKSINRDRLCEPLIIQLIRCATSIGANYCEAIGASSRRDFRNKIFLCKKECQESKYWLKLLESYFPQRTEELGRLWKEAQDRKALHFSFDI